MKLIINRSRHICELPQQEIFKLKKHSSLSYRLKKKWFNFITVSDKHPTILQYFRSELEMENERNRHYNGKDRYTIYPFSAFRRHYDVFRLLLYISALIAKPLANSFSKISTGESLYYSLLLVNVFCMFDIIFHFFFGYDTTDTRQIMLSRSIIARKYITSPFFFADVVSSFPLNLYCYCRNTCDIYDLDYHILNLLEYFKYARIFSIPRLLDHLINYFSITAPTFIAFVKIFIICLLLTHFIGCHHIYLPYMRFWNHDINNPKQWLYKQNLQNSTMTEQYFAAYFRGIAFSLGVYINYNKVSLIEEYALVACNFIVGKLILWTVIVYYLVRMLTAKSSETEYYSFMDELNEYTPEKQLTLKMRQRLKEYYEFKFQRKYYKNILIEELLPKKLLMEIKYTNLIQVTRNIELFSSLTLKEISEIVPHLEEDIFLPNDTIIKSGTYGDSMYFLASGTVAVLTKSGKEICHLYDGDYFGEISMLQSDYKRDTTIIAIEVCHIYCMTRKSFGTFFKNHKELYEVIAKRAKKRLEYCTSVETDYKKMLYSISIRNSDK